MADRLRTKSSIVSTVGANLLISMAEVVMLLPTLRLKMPRPFSPSLSTLHIDEGEWNAA